MAGAQVPTSAGRVFDEAAAELEILRQLLADGLQVSDLEHERKFRLALQRVAECCENHETVMAASLVLRTAAVRAFAMPSDAHRLEVMHAALAVLTSEVEKVRAELIQRRIARGHMPERRSAPREDN
jgi:hypothetical protein